MHQFSYNSREVKLSKTAKSSGGNHIPLANTKAREQTVEACNPTRGVIPQTKAEAQEHIARIREERGLDRPNKNTEDLEAALSLLVF